MKLVNVSLEGSVSINCRIWIFEEILDLEANDLGPVFAISVIDPKYSLYMFKSFEADGSEIE